MRKEDEKKTEKPAGGSASQHKTAGLCRVTKAGCAGNGSLHCYKKRGSCGGAVRHCGCLWTIGAGQYRLSLIHILRRIFGIGAIKMTEKVELVINLEPWEDGKQYDRLGMDGQTTSILDIAVPSLTIPVKPGRNLAVIIEVAAMNDRQKKMGFNAAKELQERMLKQYGN